MRELTFTYVRHTIKRPIRPGDIGSHLKKSSRLRQSAGDYFFTFCRQIIPQLEDRVERQLLNKFKEQLETQAEKEEVEWAYLQRKDNLAKIPEKQEPGEPEPKAPKLFIPNTEFHNVIASIRGDGLSYHTYTDVGRYTVFPDVMRKRMFPSKFFGRYEEDEFKLT